MLRRVALTTLLLAALAPAAPAMTRFRVVDLGLLPGGASATPSRLEPGGAALGSCDVGGVLHAVRWTVSPAGDVLAVTDLAGLAGYSGSTACAMNAAGWVVGFSNTAAPQPRAVLWRDGAVLDLDRGADGNANVYAFDVNDAGVICGMITKSGGGGGWNAAVWVERAGQPDRFDRTFLPLDPLGGLFGWTEANRVDATGRVFGRSNLGFNGDRATIWENDVARTPVLLAPLAGSQQSMPGDCNDLGDAVGYTILPFGLARPTRWSRDAAHVPAELPLLPGDNSASATAVSPGGALVLGRSESIDTSVFPPALLAAHVVAWEGAHVFDLQRQLEPGSAGWSLQFAAGVDADGRILAGATQGGAERAVLLVPVVEPLAVGAEAAPARVALAAPWPNPARGDVRVAFTLAAVGEARLAILDAQGRQVAQLVAGRFGAGRHEGTWDGRDAAGVPAAAGLYFAVLEAGGRRESARFARVR